MYTMQYRTRFSEVGADGCLTLPALVNLFQDCSTFHSEDVGVGLRQLQEEKCIWMLSFWQIIVERYPSLCEDVTVSTAPYAFEQFYGKRNFWMQDREGNYLAKANSIWFFYDLAAGKPIRPSESQTDAYGLEKPLEMEYVKRRKIALPKEMEACTSFPVHRDDLDTNLHVNNGRYIRMAAEYFPQGPIREMRAEYRTAAKYGDVICPRIGTDGPWTVIALCDEVGKPYATVEVRQ